MEENGVNASTRLHETKEREKGFGILYGKLHIKIFGVLYDRQYSDVQDEKTASTTVAPLLLPISFL